MDQQAIEDHKQQMLADNRDLYEGVSGRKVVWRVSNTNEVATIKMTILDSADNVVTYKVSQIKQLNG